jgi:hypothetical protein
VAREDLLRLPVIEHLRATLGVVPRKTYKLDHATKGTGASVVPLEGDKQQGEREMRTIPMPPRERPAQAGRGPKVSTPLPPGHVRKKSTGEIGRVRAVDPKAGTITVQWLHGGATSTVPMATVTRR